MFPPVKIHGAQERICKVHSWKAFYSFQLLRGLCHSSRSSSWSKGLGTSSSFKPFASDLPEVISEVPLLTPVPHHTYSGRGTKGLGSVNHHGHLSQGLVQALSSPYAFGLQEQRLLPTVGLCIVFSISDVSEIPLRNQCFQTEVWLLGERCAFFPPPPILTLKSCKFNYIQVYGEEGVGEISSTYF